MQGRFTRAVEVERDQLGWGTLAWHCRPGTTGAEDLVVIEVTFSPGGGHNFHLHPHQEEVIYVIEGKIESWVGTNSQDLAPGDSVFIPKNTVHGSFNASSQNSRLLAILGPSIGRQGYETEDVSGESPWNTLRT